MTHSLMINSAGFLEETKSLTLKEIGILMELITHKAYDLSFDSNLETYDISKRSKNIIREVFLNQSSFIEAIFK